MNPQQHLTPINYSNTVAPQQFVHELRVLGSEQRERDIQQQSLASTQDITKQWAVTAQDNKLLALKAKIDSLLSDTEKQQLLEPGNFILVTENYGNPNEPASSRNTTLYGLFLVGSIYRVETGSGPTVLHALIREALKGTPYSDGMPYGGTRPTGKQFK